MNNFFEKFEKSVETASPVTITIVIVVASLLFCLADNIF